MKQTALRRKTGLKPGKPKARKARKPWRPPAKGLAAWKAEGKIVRERSGGRCERIFETKPFWIAATWRCNKPTNQRAHVHGVGRRHAGGRYYPNARCPDCKTWINKAENLKDVCSLTCNNAVARPCPGRNQ